MATNNFTAVGPGADLTLAPGESAIYTLSGTFSATVILERTKNNWITHERLFTFTAGASGAYVNESTSDDRIRFRCTDYTSGTAVGKLFENEDVVPGGGGGGGGGTSPANLPGTNVADLGLEPLDLDDDVTDQTNKIKEVVAGAVAGGYSLFFPPGRYNYSNLIADANCSIYGVPGRTFIHHIGADGKNARWDVVADGYVCYGITFVVDKTPSDAINDAGEADCILRVRNCSNPVIERCVFKNCYGTAVLFRAVDGGEITRNMLITGYKDAFHVTGGSRDIKRTYNVVVNGGDDAFPVVSYRTGTGAGLCENIIDHGNIVRGVKFARCFAYVGAKNVRLTSFLADGKVPDSFEPDASHWAASGVYIHSESGFDTDTNSDIYVADGVVMNCGSSVLGAITVQNRGGVDPARGIKILRTKVINSAKQALLVDGKSAGQLYDCTFDLDIEDNTDPNGVTGTAGEGQAAAVELKYLKDFVLTGTIAKSARYAIFVGNTCSGKGKIDVRTRKANMSGTAGIHVISAEAASGGNLGAELDVELTVLEQDATATIAGTPEFIQTAMTFGTGIRVSRVRYWPLVKDLDKGISIASAPAQTITPTGSPFTWVPSREVTVGEEALNLDLPYPVSVRVSGGTVTKIEVGAYSGVGSPVFIEPISGATKGRFMVFPGQAFRITYDEAPSNLSFVPCIS